MKSLQITVNGRIPSKKNMLVIKKKGTSGRYISPSDKFKAWHEEQSWLLRHKVPDEPIQKCKVDIVFYPPDKRTADSNNKAASILDLLADNGIIEDDNWFCVVDDHYSMGGVDRENPRAEITISIL